MIRELPKVIERLARKICYADGVHPDAIVHHFPDKYYWEEYIPQARAAYEELLKIEGER